MCASAIQKKKNFFSGLQNIKHARCLQIFVDFSSLNVYIHQNPCSQRSIYIICMHTYHKFCIYIKFCHLPPIKNIVYIRETFSFTRYQTQTLACPPNIHPPPHQFDFLHGPSTLVCVCKKKQNRKMKLFLFCSSFFVSESLSSFTQPPTSIDFIACCSHIHMQIICTQLQRTAKKKHRKRITKKAGRFFQLKKKKDFFLCRWWEKVMHGKKSIFLSSYGKMRLRFLKFSPLAPPLFFSHFFFH